MPAFYWNFFFTDFIILGASAFVSFYIVRDSLNASNLKIYAGTFLFSIVYALTSAWVHIFTNEILCSSYTIVAVIGGAALYYHFVDEPKGKLTFILLLVAHCSFFCYDTASITYWDILNDQLSPILLSFALFYPLFTWLLQKIWARVRDVTNMNWYSLSLLPVMFIVLSLATRNVFIVSADMLLYSIKMVIVLVIDICAFITYFMLITAVSRVQEKNRLESNLRNMNDNLAAQASRMNDLTVHIEEVKTIRHDMRHHMLTLDGMLEAGKTEDARAYLANLKRNTPERATLPLCRNYVADGIVSRYIAVAREQGIMVDAALSIPEAPGVDHTDLAIVLGNLMENAVEACERQSGDEKFIRVEAKTESDRLMILICNSFDGIVQKQGDTFQSRKRKEGCGVGLRSVAAIAKKYGGLVSFNRGGNEFKASVLLYPADSNGSH